MTNIGFTSFDVKEDTTPTTQEVLALLTNEQKLFILDGFTNKVKPDVLHRMVEVSHPAYIVKYLYGKFADIRDESARRMRGEILITPAVYDDEGNETSPAVYNTPPTTSTQLLNEIKDQFAEDFNESQVSAILTKMVKYSKSNGTGNWTYYKTEIRK